MAAQQEHSYELDPVTITAGWYPEPQSATGRDIQVITGRQLALLPVHSIDEVLRYLPGVEVQARGAMGAQSDIVIRGGTYQQVLVILDGIRLNDPVTGHFSSYIPVAPAEIERIEILKGAASAIYGTEAVGGVIQIITKTFAGTTQKEASLQATAGNYGLWGVQGGLGWKGKTTAVNAGLLTNHAAGPEQRGTTGFFDLTTVSVSVSQKLGNYWTLNGRVATDYRSFAAQNFYTSFRSDTATEKVASWWSQVQAAYQKGRWTLRADAGYKKLNDVYTFSPTAAANENTSALVQGLLLATAQIRTNSRLSIGTQFLSKNMESNDRGNQHLTQQGLFAIYRQDFKNLHLEPALRVELHPRFGIQWLPQLNTSWVRRQVTLRGSVGRTIRDADFTERFNNYNKPLVKSGSIGNPALTAERALSYELGTDWQLKKSLKLSATAFRRDQTNLIDFVPTPYAEMPRKENLISGGNYALAQNIASVHTSGLEFCIAGSRRRKNHQLEGSAGFVWLKSEGINGTPGFYISSHARFLVNGFITYRYRLLTLSATFLHKDRQTFEAPAIEAQVKPAYTTLGLRGEFAVKHWIGVFIQADNISNSHYSDLLGAQMPGRWWSGGLKLIHRRK